MSLSESASYDFRTAAKNMRKELNRLEKKYKNQLLRKYDLDEKSLSKINTEGLLGHWPSE